MKLRFNKKYICWGITAFLVLAAAICFYYLVFFGNSFLASIKSIIHVATPVIYGVIFAYLLTPIINTIEKSILIPFFKKIDKELSIKARKRMRAGSIILALLFVFLILYGFFALVIPQIITSIRNITYQFPTYVDNLTYWATKFLADNPDIEALVVRLLDNYSEELSHYLNNNIVPQLKAIVKTVSLSLLSFAYSMWNLIIGIIISIYVLYNKELFLGQSKKIAYALFTTKRANQLIKDARFTSETFIGFISGKIVDSIIIGILCFIGTSLIGIPYAVLVSVIVGVTNVIPFFGPYLGAIPSALLILMVSPIHCLYFIIFILFLQQVDGNFIGPKILGSSTGLSGFWVIFSITIFGGIFGIPGMIIGVPIFAVFYAWIKRAIARRLKKRDLPTDTNPYLNVEAIENNVFIDTPADFKSRKSSRKHSENKATTISEVDEPEQPHSMDSEDVISTEDESKGE